MLALHSLMCSTVLKAVSAMYFIRFHDQRLSANQDITASAFEAVRVVRFTIHLIHQCS